MFIVSTNMNSNHCTFKKNKKHVSRKSNKTVTRFNMPTDKKSNEDTV